MGIPRCRSALAAVAIGALVTISPLLLGDIELLTLDSMIADNQITLRARHKSFHRRLLNRAMRVMNFLFNQLNWSTVVDLSRNLNNREH